MRTTAIGIDIGGTNLRAARVSSAGDVLDRVGERIIRDPEAVIGRIVALARLLDATDVAAIGIGVPGRVDGRRSHVFSGAYLDFAGLGLAAQVEAALNRPVTVENDGTMALKAEHALGAARGFGHVVMFVIGTGIGGAVMLDGRFARGRATAGQLGHLAVETNGLPCTCGRRGCVETTSSGTALNRLIAEAGLPAGTAAEALFEREADGDAAASRVLDAWARPLRAAIDSAVAAVDPEIVILGGGLGGTAHRALLRAPAVSPWYQCPVTAASLGDEAGVIGAALMALASIATAGVSP